LNSYFSEEKKEKFFEIQVKILIKKTSGYNQKAVHKINYERLLLVIFK